MQNKRNKNKQWDFFSKNNKNNKQQWEKVKRKRERKRSITTCRSLNFFSLLLFSFPHRFGKHQNYEKTEFFITRKEHKWSLVLLFFEKRNQKQNRRRRSFSLSNLYFKNRNNQNNPKLISFIMCVCIFCNVFSSLLFQ